MKFNLSIVLDRNYENREDLYTTTSLEEMDKYLSKFNDHMEIRALYRDNIQEFLLDNMEYIKKMENKNNRLNNGRICITFLDRHNVVRSIAIIYKNERKLLNKRACLAKIKEELMKETVLNELYLRKRYLLTQNEIDLLRNYFLFPVSYRKYKEMMIDWFVGRLRSYPKERSYLYLRSLMNVCSLQDVYPMDIVSSESSWDEMEELENKSNVRCKKIGKRD